MEKGVETSDQYFFKKRLSQNVSELANRHVTPYTSEDMYHCFGKLLIETLWDKRKPEIESRKFFRNFVTHEPN